jgi:hypothetical protein
MRFGIFTKVIVLLAISLNASAQVRFADMMMSLSGNKKLVVAEVPDRAALNQVKTLDEASALGRSQTYKKMLETETNQKSIDINQIMQLVQKKKTTIVIVPGLFGEFIETRAFEEVFARKSSEKIKWQQMIQNRLMVDDQYNLEKNQFEKVRLADLIDVASIDDKKGNALVKIAILKTKLGSLESIGSMAEKAKIFNRRLQAFAKLNKEENLVLLGYSRGTPLALEMVAQAQQQNLPYLAKVKAVVAYAGVILGSSLADLTDDPNTQSGRQFIAVKKLLSNLQSSDGIFDRTWKGPQNGIAIGEFLTSLAINSEFDPDSFLMSARSGDFETVSMLVAKVLRQFSFMAVTDFNGHVLRVRKFISEILASVEDLKTKNRVAWFQNHVLPKSIKYYSISAAMVDPAKSDLENDVYQKRIGYNDTIDDRNLEGNRRSYEAATGFAMNDSQVAIHQSTFLPKLIQDLNPQNSNLNVEALALMQTHHWGVSLRTVNVMRDGTVNPFPRENVLMALAAYLNQ